MVATRELDSKYVFTVINTHATIARGVFCVVCDKSMVLLLPLLLPTVEPEEMATARELYSKHISMVTNKHRTIGRDVFCVVCTKSMLLLINVC